MNTYVNVNDTVRENDSATIQAAVDMAREQGIYKVLIPRINSRTGEAI